MKFRGLLNCYTKQSPRISVWEFSSQGIPLKTWEDKQAAIETILDITIVKMKYGSGKSRVLLYTVPARTDLPEVLDWNDKYLSHNPFILALGESFTGPVTVDLVKVPHILLGGSTGSGKSVLLKLLLYAGNKERRNRLHCRFQRRCGFSAYLAQALPDVH